MTTEFNGRHFLIVAAITLACIGFKDCTAEVRNKRALFSSGKFVNSKKVILPENHKSQSKTITISSPQSENILASILRVQQDLEEKKKEIKAKRKSSSSKIAKKFSNVLKKLLTDPSFLPDLLFDVNEAQGDKPIPLIGDRTAELLCQEIHRDTVRKDELNYLLTPLNIAHYTRTTEINYADKVWYQRGCFAWKYESCEGYSRYPLEEDCKFWNPIPIDNPGCPKLDRRIQVDWRTLSPNNCTCKYPCTEKYAPVQECYLPHLTQPKSLLNNNEKITLSLENVKYLCRSMFQVVTRGTSIGVSWIPIRIKMSLDTDNLIKQGATTCIKYTFTPCKDREPSNCGKWIKETKPCKEEDGQNSHKRSTNSKELDQATLRCPCQLPCLRIFDSINKCKHLDAIATELDMSSEEFSALKPSKVFNNGDLPSEVSNRIVECNYYERSTHCTVIPKYEDNPSLDKKHSTKRIGGRVQCSYVDGKAACPFVWDD